jgi:predicted metal-dependent hydrolase
VADPELKRQVAGFIGQEAIHGREHRALNDRLDELGYPTKRTERFTEKGLALRERLMSPAVRQTQSHEWCHRPHQTPHAQKQLV